MRWYLFALSRSFQWRGRATRSEFWIYTVINTLLLILLGIFHFMLPILGGLIANLYAIGTLPASLAVQSRRLHDTNHSAWWMLAPAVFVGVSVPAMVSAIMLAHIGHHPVDRSALVLSGIGMLIAAIFDLILFVFFLLKGTPGENKYGPEAPTVPY